MVLEAEQEKGFREISGYLFLGGESGERGLNNIQEYVQVLYVDVSAHFVPLIYKNIKIMCFY